MNELKRDDARILRDEMNEWLGMDMMYFDIDSYALALHLIYGGYVVVTDKLRQKMTQLNPSVSKRNHPSGEI